MILPPLVRWLLLFAVIPCLGVTWIGLHLGLDCLEHPLEHVRLVYEFDPTIRDSSGTLEQACEVLKQRLEGIGGRRVDARVQDDGSIVLEGRMLPSHETEAQLRELLEQSGTLAFLACADREDVKRLGSDLDSERERLDRWRAEHPGSSIEDFFPVARDSGGPIPGLVWYPETRSSGTSEPATAWVPLLSPAPDSEFTESDLSSVAPTRDQWGGPAISLELVADRAPAFADFTEPLIGRQMAIVLSSRILVASRVEGRLPGSMIIEGGSQAFAPSEIRRWVAILRSGPLPAIPAFVSASRSPAKDDLSGILWIGFGAMGGLAAAVLVGVFLLDLRTPRPAPTTDGPWKSV